MEEKIEKLRNAIKANPNLSEEFKCNVGTLTDLIVTVFPDFDYSNMESLLTNLKVGSNETILSYSSYDRESNTLSFNTERIFDDRIDMQHLFLNEILKNGTRTTLGYEGFKDGVTETISSVINEDTSMKKLNPLYNVLIVIFSEIVDPSILLASYMNGSVVDVIAYLDSIGISKQEFDNLATSFNELDSNDTAFTNAEVQMIDMYRKVVSNKLESGVITKEDISSEFDKFSESLISSRSLLISLYPHHDFSNVTGFENVENALRDAIVKLENKDEILDISMPVK